MALLLCREVAGLYVLLELDPLHLSRGEAAGAVCPPDQAQALLSAHRSLLLGQGASVIGKALAGPAGRVPLRTAFGGGRLVDLLIGDHLPLIC